MCNSRFFVGLIREPNGLYKMQGKCFGFLVQAELIVVFWCTFIDFFWDIRNPIAGRIWVSSQLSLLGCILIWLSEYVIKFSWGYASRGRSLRLLFDIYCCLRLSCDCDWFPVLWRFCFLSLVHFPRASESRDEMTRGKDAVKEMTFS